MTFKHQLAAAAAAATIAIPAVAGADATRSHGYWQSFYVASGSNGQPICGVEARFGGYGWARPEGMVLIKRQISRTLFIQVSKIGWQIPVGQPITVSFQIDSAPPLTLRAVGVAPARGLSNGMFEADVGLNDPSPISGNPLWRDLVNLMGNGAYLRIDFPDGSEPGWTTSLSGFAASVIDMAGCVRTAFTAPPEPYGSTQPYTAAAPYRTQPF